MCQGREVARLEPQVRPRILQYPLLEIARLWPHLMRDVPVRDVVVRDVPALEGRSGQRTH